MTAYMAAEKNISGLILCGCGYIGNVLAGAIVRLKEEAAGRRSRVALAPRRCLTDILRQARAKHKGLTRIHLMGIGLDYRNADMDDTRAQEEENALVEFLRTAKKDGISVIRYASWPLNPRCAELYAGLTQEVVGDVQPFEYFVLTSRPALSAARLRTANILAHSAGNAFFNELYRTAGFICRVMQAHPARAAEVTEELVEHLCSLAKEADLSPAMQKYRVLYRLYGHREIRGKTPAMEQLRDTIATVAAADDVRVLIQGETGTGKESVATYLHLNSPRWQNPLLSFNCASSNPQLLEGLFLGFKKNTFTGATQDRKGIFEQANGGTLFLDEIGDLPLEAQGVLLRILEEKRFLPLGSAKEVTVDVRLITATNKNLRRMAAEGKFRPDLLYRLQEFTIKTPSLRHVKADIPRLADTIWRARCGQRLPDAAAPVLLGYDWPGNARELTTFLKYVQVMGGKDWALLLQNYLDMNNWDDEPAPLPPIMGKTDANTVPLPDAPRPLEDVLREHCRHVLDLCQGNQTRAAGCLGISRNTLRRYL